jgi:hypothetical protein
MIPITAREIIGKGWRPFGQRYSVVSGEFITLLNEGKGVIEIQFGLALYSKFDEAEMI